MAQHSLSECTAQSFNDWNFSVNLFLDWLYLATVLLIPFFP
ncbi:hypothetical protein [Pseudoalteromonas holothuriae]|nr:hypothetical protein [Pseudoalteromonas sp. CIP111951]